MLQLHCNNTETYFQAYKVSLLYAGPGKRSADALVPRTFPTDSPIRGHFRSNLQLCASVFPDLVAKRWLAPAR